MLPGTSPIYVKRVRCSWDYHSSRCVSVEVLHSPKCSDGFFRATAYCGFSSQVCTCFHQAPATPGPSASLTGIWEAHCTAQVPTLVPGLRRGTKVSSSQFESFPTAGFVDAFKSLTVRSWMNRSYIFQLKKIFLQYFKLSNPLGICRKVIDIFTLKANIVRHLLEQVSMNWLNNSFLAL